MNNSTTEKQKPWVYLIFFIMGILSYPLGGFLLELLSENLIRLQNALCELGQCGLDLGFAFGFLFPILVCSFLLAIGLYIFKERSLIFALKVFTISFIVSSLLLFGGIIYFPDLFWPLVFLSILFVIALIAFKKQPLFSFELRAFSISFIALFLIITGLFMWAAFAEAMQGIRIEDVNKPLNKFEYTEITEAELEEYPVLKKATSIEGYSLDMNSTEWEQTQKFLDNKWRERSNLFIIDKKYLEEELNKSFVTVKMMNIFLSEKYPIPENSYIKLDNDKWYVIKRYYVFSITDPEVEKELSRINITTDKDTGDVVPVKLKNAFSSSGFSLPEDARISSENEEWVIPVGTGYTILKEEGRLNVYTGDEKIYEIRKEDGELKIVYVGPQGDPVFKVREKYYRFTFWVS